MASAKVVVLYPQPSDPATFDQLYADDHVPMVLENFPTLTSFRTARVVGAPQGQAPYYWVAELHFASMEALQAALSTEGAQRTVGHGIEISTGGPMTVLVCDETHEHVR